MYNKLHNVDESVTYILKDLFAGLLDPPHLGGAALHAEGKRGAAELDYWSERDIL